MTKKSFTRQQRDAKDMLDKTLPPNQCWDELNGIYDAAKLTLQQHNMVATYKNSPEVLKHLENPASTVNNLRVLGKDIQQLSVELTEIHNKHKDKTGGSKNIDDVMRTIELGSEYQTLLQKHDAVVMPTALKVLEDFAAAEQKVTDILASQGQVMAPAEEAEAKEVMAQNTQPDIVDVEVISKEIH